jgi:glycosyltransferase involved in cell wall biosynthesis
LKLSVIIPAFNAEASIKEAIDSVLEQVTDFDFEIILFDDGSTDSTLEIARSILGDRKNSHILSSSVNRGKGYAVSKAYSVAKGQYIQILDADDFLVLKSKFQEQVDFLDKNKNASAVAHNTLILNSNTANVTSFESKVAIYSYEDVLNFRMYFHTSSVIVRKFNENLPSYFEEVKSLRGDSAFLFFHVYKFKGEVGYIPKIMSVYNIHGGGIWTSLSAKSKYQLVLQLFQDLQKFVIDDSECEENEWLNQKIVDLELAGESSFETQDLPQLNEILNRLMLFAGQVYQPETHEKIKNSINVSHQIDALSALLGRLVLRGFSENVPLIDDKNKRPKIIILLSGLRQTGGGIFKELLNLIQIHNSLGFHVIVISTEMSEQLIEDFPIELTHQFATLYRFSDSDLNEKLFNIFRIVLNNPCVRFYALVSHHDVVAAALLQPKISQRLIVYFVYDHISSLGVTNPSVDLIITKFMKQASTLRSIPISTDISAIAPFVLANHDTNPYLIFEDGFLNSATASARSYKIEGAYAELFFGAISELLRSRPGNHYHYGPLTPDFVNELQNHLTAQGLDHNRFIRLPFKINFQSDLVERRVGLYVVTSEIQSILTAIEVQTCGIPCLVYLNEYSNNLLSVEDLYGNGQLFWKDLNDFKIKVRNLSGSKLNSMSEAGFTHYLNEFSLVRATEDFRNLNPILIEIDGSQSMSCDLDRFPEFSDIYRKVFGK